MNWLTPLLTLAGTVVGASITLVAERLRWRREHRERHARTCREAYAGYLAALHATSEGLRAVSHGEHDAAVSRSAAARAAYRDADVNAAREEVTLLAAAPVVRAADRAQAALRALRNMVGEGAAQDSPEHQRALAAYQSALRELRNVMRSDLGSPSLRPG